MKLFLHTLIVVLLSHSNAMAQPDTTFLKELMQAKPALFSGILNHPNHNEVQIMYTQINRDKNNLPTFKTFTYRLNNSHYFYPASTVKLAAVIFAFEKVNELKKKVPISAYSTMITDSSFTGQTKVYKDESSENGLPSIAHYIKKILLTSDNDAFNRLYEFIGRQAFNEKLRQNGLVHSRIINRLAIGDGGLTSKHTNPIRFYEKDNLIYLQAPQFDPNEYPLPLTNLIVGKGYMDSKDNLVMKPYSFENKNVFTIEDQHLLLKKLMFPMAFPKKERFNLSQADYTLIYTYMSEYPTESSFPKYNQSEFWPTYAKMLFYGREKQATPLSNVRIFNKYGDSYGFIIDNSYLVDFKNGVEFLLTAVVQSNEDGIYNDSKYEYETVCYPFMKNLGQEIYQYELNSKKRFKPKLETLRLTYK